MSQLNMSKQQLSVEDLSKLEGKEIGISEWFLVDQKRIDAFAECTNDHQWIHIDPERCAKESPYQTTISHGFLTLSLLSPMHLTASYIPVEAKSVINYGLDAIRFMSPVKTGSKVRGRIKLIEVKARGRNMYFIKTHNTIEIEGEKKAALTAELIMLITT